MYAIARVLDFHFSTSVSILINGIIVDKTVKLLSVTVSCFFVLLFLFLRGLDLTLRDGNIKHIMHF